MSCEACERIRYNMASDPEMNRGEVGMCSACRRIKTLEEQLRARPSQAEVDAIFEAWFAIRHKRLTKKDRENPAFRNLSRLAFEFGIAQVVEWQTQRT